MFSPGCIDFFAFEAMSKFFDSVPKTGQYHKLPYHTIPPMCLLYICYTNVDKDGKALNSRIYCMFTERTLLTFVLTLRSLFDS